MSTREQKTKNKHRSCNLNDNADSPRLPPETAGSRSVKKMVTAQTNREKAEI